MPLPVGLFGLAALSVVILDQVMGLVVVLAARPARLVAVPAAALAMHRAMALNLLRIRTAHVAPAQATSRLPATVTLRGVGVGVGVGGVRAGAEPYGRPAPAVRRAGRRGWCAGALP